jgi:hypothetical protein
VNVCDVEPWCRAGNGGAIGRTLLLPFSVPRAWEPGALPRELAALTPTAGYPLRSARKVRDMLGLPIAIGFTVLSEHPDEPFAHAFNVHRGHAVDLALAEHQPIAYWGYVPSPSQLAVDKLSLAVEAPPASAFRRLTRRRASRAATCP